MYTNILILFCQSGMCYTGDAEPFKRDARRVLMLLQHSDAKQKLDKYFITFYKQSAF